MKTNNKMRNSSLEILRIIAMFCIICSHYMVHGGVAKANIEPGFNMYLIGITFLGNLGSDIFFLISGYFLIKSKFDAKKAIKLIFQVVFYSVCIYFFLLITGFVSFNSKQIFEVFFPTIFRKYWFFTAYIVFYILSPYINLFFNQLSRKTHFSLIATMLVLWCFIPSFFGQGMMGTELLQFFMLYSIGAYIRLYPDCSLMKKQKGAILAIVSLALILIFKVAFMYSSTANMFYKPLTARTSFLVVGLAVGLLIIFLKMKPRDLPIINTISSCVFGVYLIHDNSFLRPLLWKGFLKNSTYATSPMLIVHMILSVIFVFVVCAVIEFIRQKIIEKPFMLFVNKYYDRALNAVKSKLISFKK